MRLLYFAWVAERIGAREEICVAPGEVATVARLLDWLAARSPGHRAALADRALVRVAVNQAFATADTPIADGDEIAIFPPVTGG